MNKDMILSQFEIKMFYSWQYDSAGVAPQYELNIFVNMATYWVPDLLDIKGFSGSLHGRHPKREKLGRGRIARAVGDACKDAIVIFITPSN